MGYDDDWDGTKAWNSPNAHSEQVQRKLNALYKLALDLNIAADNAVGLLHAGGFPAASQSLNRYVVSMKEFLEKEKWI